MSEFLNEWELYKEMKMSEDYIKMDELKHGYLYEIFARNASFGIWNKDLLGFVISRFKFGSYFTFVEHHWDCESFATAKPFKEVEKAPFDPNDYDEIEALDYLNQKAS